ncbi:MAG TPA: PKD domain-containing protein [Longimicrobiaceae bacterium]|nr:PKD domain-containing protein [Longimicrobiaceae bacterium]
MRPPHHFTLPNRRGRTLALLLCVVGLAACDGPLAPDATPGARPALQRTSDNQPPTVDMGGPYTGVAGAPIQFDASGTTDPEGDYLYYYWEFGDSTGWRRDTVPTFSHTYRAPGTYDVTLWVADYHDPDAANWVMGSLTVEVTSPLPVVASVASGSGVAVELQMDNSTGTTVAVTFESVGTAGAVEVSRLYYDPYNPMAPTIPSGFTLPGGAYYDISTTATFSGPVSVCLSYDPAYYEASGTQPRLLHGETVDGTQQWVDRTTYVDPVKLLVCGTVASFSPFGVGARHAPVGVRHAPTIGAVTLPAVAVQTGGAVDVSAAFSDADAGDTHAVPGTTIAWGDGTTSRAGVGGTLRVAEPAAGAAGSVRGTHAYAAAGVYTVRVTVTDADGARASAVAEYVVVYDPGAFVAGGGWINSVAGAFKPNPGLAGRASFGFVSRYQKGATRPSGSTHFQFHAADLLFRSTSYDWLTVGGAKAMYHGTGTVTGLGAGLDGTYQFQLTAYDGQAAGGDGTDRFRIRIYGGPAGLLYDNEWTRGANDDATTALGGGSIQIQTR